MSKDVGNTTAVTHAALRDPGTPSTFGDDFDYDQSISMSRQTSIAGSSFGTGLYPQLDPPSGGQTDGITARTASASSSNFSTMADVGNHESGKSSVASRLIGYLGIGRGSATPPPPTSDDTFKRPLPRAPSSLRSQPDSAESTTPSPTGPEMVQIHRGTPTALVEPLRMM